MPKDKNLGKHKSRYEVRGGVINEYEFGLNEGAMTEEEHQRFARQQAQQSSGAKKSSAKKGGTAGSKSAIASKIAGAKGGGAKAAGKAGAKAGAKKGAAKSREIYTWGERSRRNKMEEALVKEGAVDKRRRKR